MLKPYNRNIRTFNEIIHTTRLSEGKQVQLRKLLSNCLSNIIKYIPTNSCDILCNYVFDTDKYCIVLGSLDMMNPYTQGSYTCIDIYSPISYRTNMYRVIDSYPYLINMINSMFEYVIYTPTLYIIETNYKNLEQIKQVIRECNHA